MPSWFHYARYVPQAIFRFRGVHVAEKVTRHHHVLRSNNAYQPRITCILEMPANSFPNPRSDLRLGPVTLKQLLKFPFRQPLEYRRTNEIRKLTCVNRL